MEKGLFDGAGFEDSLYKPLLPQYYPQEYKKYIKEEVQLLRKRVMGASSILEAGVGIGRLIPELAPLVKEFVGIDKSDFMMKTSRRVAKKFSHVTIIQGDLEKLDTLFMPKHFDFSLCMWNTLGNVYDDVLVLKQLGNVTKKSIFVTVHKKGEITKRKNWYATVGITPKKVDEEHEIFYFEGGVPSRSYSLADLTSMAKQANLTILSSKTLGGVVLWAELSARLRQSL